MDRIGIVMVGLNFGGHITREIASGDASQYLKLLGVCDLDQEKARETAADLGVRHYTSLEEILGDSSVEAIGLFTSPDGRAQLIRKVIRAGKHVLTTKPFERSATEALDVLREAQRLGKVVALNSPSLVPPPDLQQIQVWREAFELGKPVAARMDVWASYHETADGRWYDDPERCPVAPIFRIGVYLINDAVRLFGEASEVRVISSRIRTQRPTPDNAQISILFHGGGIVNIFASFCVDDGDAHRNAMTLNFERGTIYRNSGPLQEDGYPRGSEMTLVRRGEHGREIAERVLLPGFNPQHAYQWETFRRLVRGERGIQIVSPEITAAAIRIIEAMALAERQGGSAQVQRG